MPSLNFKKQFIGKIASGEKTQTIRAPRVRPIKVGDPLYLYAGMRTHACTKIMEAVCTYTTKVVIYTDLLVSVGGIILDEKRTSELARADGFSSVKEFLEFFQIAHGLPFEGDLIQWKPRKADDAAA